MTPPPIPWWGSATSPGLERQAGEGLVAVLPVAAVEQHGSHLPLSTDLDIGLGLLGEAVRHLPDAFPLRVLPPLAVGASLEHEAWPGTLSVPGSVLEAMVVAMGAGVARAGGRRLVVSNSHGGNQGPLEQAALRLRSDHGLLVVKAYYPRFGPPPEGATPGPFPPAEWTHGLHGGAVETSMMLHLRPELVQMDRIEATEAGSNSLGPDLEAAGSRIGSQGSVPFAWLAGDLSASGVTGDPSLASAEAGARLVAHYGGVLAQVIRDAAAFPLDRLA